jgi:hypothetical protein
MANHCTYMHNSTPAPRSVKCILDAEKMLSSPSAHTLKWARVLACSAVSTRALSACYVRLEDERVTEGASWRNLNLLTSSSRLYVAATAAALYSTHQNKLARREGLVAPGYSGCVLTGCLYYNQLFACKFLHHSASKLRRWVFLWCDFRLLATNVYHNWGHIASLTLSLAEHSASLHFP